MMAFMIVSAVAFAAYIAFFPCLLYGPIDRPQFLGQLHKTRSFDYDLAAEGIRQFSYILDDEIMLGDRHGHADYIDLLKAVPAYLVAGDVSCDSYHWH